MENLAFAGGNIFDGIRTKKVRRCFMRTINSLWDRRRFLQGLNIGGLLSVAGQPVRNAFVNGHPANAKDSLIQRMDKKAPALGE
jgi:hypothetical protein